MIFFISLLPTAVRHVVSWVTSYLSRFVFLSPKNLATYIWFLVKQFAMEKKINRHQRVIIKVCNLEEFVFGWTVTVWPFLSFNSLDYGLNWKPTKWCGLQAGSEQEKDSGSKKWSQILDIYINGLTSLNGSIYNKFIILIKVLFRKKKIEFVLFQ